jgi:hypothetical protein
MLKVTLIDFNIEDSQYCNFDKLTAKNERGRWDLRIPW